MSNTPYRGRFAPSPTGPLHFGSLITAVASYLDARSNNGKWLVRIEDVDKTRSVPGATKAILNSLEDYGFQWDDEIVYQSQRDEHYQHFLNVLDKQSLLYGCTCSRKSIQQYKTDHSITSVAYPGICRNQSLSIKNHTVRINTGEFDQISFVDGIQGELRQSIQDEVGDFVLKRQDGIYSYQLAVVVDDALQEITHIIRGYDLFENTPRQLLLQHYLELPKQTYAHIPVATNRLNQKLSKQTFAKPIESIDAKINIFRALEFLGQVKIDEYMDCSLSEIWKYAIQNWELERVPKTNQIVVEQTV